jgi:hypothetical protein
MPTKPTRDRRKPKPASKRSGNKKWTVMLYMVAGQDQQTELAAIRDIKELEQVGSTDNVDVVVQIDRGWPGYPQRYRVWKGRSEELFDDKPLAGIRTMSSGEPEALQSFLRWVRNHARADQYLLVLWGHAYGLGFGRDHDDPLSLTELGKSLKEFAQAGRLDLLGANACAMAYAEAAYELRHGARYLVASEITMPFAGWPYAQILNEIVLKPRITAEALGKKIIEQFMKSFERSFERKDVAMTLLDLSEANSLREKIKKLALALTASICRNDARDAVADAFLDTAHGDVRPLIDLVDLCTRLTHARDPEVVKSAKQLLKNDLILEHRADRGLEGLNGLGIFAPAVTARSDLMRLDLGEEAYKKLELMKDPDNAWPALVYEGLRTVFEPVIHEVAAFVSGTGVTTREDWTGVAQLLLSVTRSFQNLERNCAVTEENITGILTNPDHASGAPPTGDTGAPTLPSGLPYLRLRELQPQSSGAATDSTGTGAAGGSGDEGAIERRQRAMHSFRNLESALAAVEKTAKRVMTHPSLGLGPGDPPFKPGGGMGPGDPPFKPGGGMGPGDPPFKPGGGMGPGDPPFKPGGGMGPGDPPFKPGGGMGPGDPPFKPGGGMGIVLSVTQGGDQDAPSEAKHIAELYSYVAGSLRELERAVAKLENLALADGTFDSIVTDEEQRQRTNDEIRRAFLELGETVTGARETALWVLAHPTYGLGPGHQLSPAGHQQLAAAGGLSPRFLRLL